MAELPVEVVCHRYASVLRSITTFAPSAPGLTRESTLANLLVLVHHALVASQTAKYDWIMLIQGAGLDPGKLVQEHGSKLRDLAWDANRDGPTFVSHYILSLFSLFLFFPERTDSVFFWSVPDIL